MGTFLHPPKSNVFIYTMVRISRFSALIATMALAGIGLAQVHVVLNGKELTFSEAQPQDFSNHVFVPMRGIFEALGASVNWDPIGQTITATKNQRRVELQIGSSQASVDGHTITMDAPARMLNGSSMVPLRFISEALGASVDWSDLAQTVTITSHETVEIRRDPVAPPKDQQRDPQRDLPRNPPNETEMRLSLTCDRTGLVGRVPMNFRLTGPRGGQAYIQVPGVSDEVQMTETQPGVYTFHWSAPPSNVIVEDTTAIAHLLVRGQDLLAELPQSLTIDTITPKIRAVSPANTGEVRTNRPDIIATLDDDAGPGINPDSVRLMLDHADITNRARISRYRVAMYPDFELAPGPHEVEIEARDIAGNLGRTHWTFVIAPPSAERYRVVWTPPVQWSVGAVIVFNADGPRGGDAVCDLGPHRGIAHLKETSAGHYVGSYRLQTGDNFDDEPVMIRIHAGAQLTSFQSSSHMRMLALPQAAPTILSPTVDRALDSAVAVSGRAAPGSKVLVHVAYSSSQFGRNRPSYGLADVMAMAGNDGKYTTSMISLAVKGGKGITYSISATSVGPDGRKSTTTTVQYRGH